MPPLQKQPVTRTGRSISRDCHPAAALSVKITPANLSFVPSQLLSRLAVSKFTSYFWLVIHYVNLKAGFGGLF